MDTTRRAAKKAAVPLKLKSSAPRPAPWTPMAGGDRGQKKCQRSARGERHPSIQTRVPEPTQQSKLPSRHLGQSEDTAPREGQTCQRVQTSEDCASERASQLQWQHHTHRSAMMIEKCRHQCECPSLPEGAHLCSQWWLSALGPSMRFRITATLFLMRLRRVSRHSRPSSFSNALPES